MGTEKAFCLGDRQLTMFNNIYSLTSRVVGLDGEGYM